MAEKNKSPDYSNSAENLCNPPEVLQKLIELHQIQRQLQELDSELQQNRTYQLLKQGEKAVADITAQIKDMVDAQGSYQDIEAGDYAVKYRRMHRDYHVEPFKQRYPKYVAAVVEEVINVKALEGLVKGGLITENDLKHPDVGVITETPQYAFFIR